MYDIIIKTIRIIFKFEKDMTFKQNQNNVYFNRIPKSLIAITLMIISGFCFVLMHSAVKYLSKEVHIFEIAFFRCVLVIFVLTRLLNKF